MGDIICFDETGLVVCGIRWGNVEKPEDELLANNPRNEFMERKKRTEKHEACNVGRDQATRAVMQF